MNKLIKEGFSKSEKKQLLIFILIAFIIPFILGIFLNYSYSKGQNIGIFSLTQMLMPAAGVILLTVLYKKNSEYPKTFFLSYLVISILMILLSLASVTYPNQASNLSQVIIMVGSILCLIFISGEKKETLQNYHLKFKNVEHSRPLIYMLLFVLFLVLRTGLGFYLTGSTGFLLSFAKTKLNFSLIFGLFITFFTSFIIFFGEEYGWRFYLQNLLQQKLGKIKGVITLGVVWALWHLPLDYVVIKQGIDYFPMILGRLITCISLSVYFGYAYLKTKSIWGPVFFHFFNNNFLTIVAAVTNSQNKAEQVESATSLQSLWFLLIVNSILFMPFVFSKVYRERKSEDNIEINV